MTQCALRVENVEADIERLSTCVAEIGRGEIVGFWDILQEFEIVGWKRVLRNGSEDEID